MCERLRLLAGRKMAAREPRDCESFRIKAFLRENDLTMLERIFVAAADEKRNLAAVCIVYAAEIEPGSLSAVLGDKAGGTI